MRKNGTNMTKEQAAAIIQNAQIERAKRTAYNAKRWEAKKAALAEATKIVAAAK